MMRDERFVPPFSERHREEEQFSLSKWDRLCGPCMAAYNDFLGALG